ncbi:GNAT family N-acetyltransferase [Pseudochrobactrum sp. MP213Fo]|uniref:GNAT family N-acetyltransferase n=1 Tax=Pseudochrobactrum sp. MP213Fo TaxID=3022250 RepID=UPI003B9DD16A
MHEEAEKETGIILRSVATMQGFDSAEWAQFPATQRLTNSRLDQHHSAGTVLPNKAYNPFLSHAYLSALEDSGCVGESTGWQPYHLRLEDTQGRLLAASPAYLKSHSQGEYVFDHGWAEAFERAGGQYYPKLQLGIPFTPATGPRILTTDHNPQIRRLLGSAIAQFTDQNGLSSAHVTFAENADIQALTQSGFLHRKDQQFHFINNGFQNYNEFLEELVSRKRKALKRERREALSNDISIDWLTGTDLTEDIWDQFFAFYMDTGSRKWGRPYLNRQFYSLIGERMADDIVLIMARREGRYIAGAINFIGGDRLFGRHWGCIEDHPFLHFEVCYHQAIDYAIAHQLAVVEAGAQGDHKLARGYEPVITHSAHYISHPDFRSAVAQYLRREVRDVEMNTTIYAEHSPFRKIHQGNT